MGSSPGPFLILIVWLLPVLYVATRKSPMDNRGGWILLTVLTGPIGLALFLFVQAFKKQA